MACSPQAWLLCRLATTAHLSGIRTRTSCHAHLLLLTAYLRRGEGLGGTTDIGVATAAREKRETHIVKGGPPTAGARVKRANPPNSELRRFYERGDLPVSIFQAVKNRYVAASVSNRPAARSLALPGAAVID